MVLYSTQLLSKQGPLRTVWVAAHLERQLKRQQVGSECRIRPGLGHYLRG